LFNFYQDFESLIDFENPNYKLLLERMDLIVKSKFDRENRLSSGKNRNEIMKEKETHLLKTTNVGTNKIVIT